jgi:hypothetical protein
MRDLVHRDNVTHSRVFDQLYISILLHRANVAYHSIAQVSCLEAQLRQADEALQAAETVCTAAAAAASF